MRGRAVGLGVVVIGVVVIGVVVIGVVVIGVVVIGVVVIGVVVIVVLAALIVHCARGAGSPEPLRHWPCPPRRGSATACRAPPPVPDHPVSGRRSGLCPARGRMRGHHAARLDRPGGAGPTPGSTAQPRRLGHHCVLLPGIPSGGRRRRAVGRSRTVVAGVRGLVPDPAARATADPGRPIMGGLRDRRAPRTGHRRHGAAVRLLATAAESDRAVQPGRHPCSAPVHLLPTTACDRDSRLAGHRRSHRRGDVIRSVVRGVGLPDDPENGSDLWRATPGPRRRAPHPGRRGPRRLGSGAHWAVSRRLHDRHGVGSNAVRFARRTGYRADSLGPVRRRVEPRRPGSEPAIRIE